MVIHTTDADDRTYFSLLISSEYFPIKKDCLGPFKGIFFKISCKNFQNLADEEILARSSGEWAPLIVGPKEIISILGNAFPKFHIPILHDRPPLQVGFETFLINTRKYF